MMTKTKADKYPQRVRNELRFRELTVLRVERAGAAFQRIVLGGEALEGFASHGFDDHTKLFFPEPGAAFTPPQVTEEGRHCCKVSDEAAFCLIQRPYISKTLLTRRISP
ncbi:siderophore-interacting protein, partial [Klebsiella pneumoniae]|nr:siderophore-interacting protein [Klebsiella pneumoniae]